MCERTCPGCNSTEHLDLYGVLGASITCAGCGSVLAWRADPEAAPIDLSDDEADAWAAARRGIFPGAEAKDPADDELWRGPAFRTPPADHSAGDNRDREAGRSAGQRKRDSSSLPVKEGER
jgi:transcription elongation factor Elf1